jgi:RNA polymerase sigma-70 factor (ECF subfamily)
MARSPIDDAIYSSSSPDIAALVRRGVAGDRQALGELIGRHQGRIARFVIYQTRDDHHFEDLCQIIFIRMVIALPRLRSPARFEAWLFQIARNVCRDHLREQVKRRSLFVPFAPAHESFSPAEARVDSPDEHAIRYALSQLPSGQRQVLELSLEQKRSYEELARLSNLGVAAVKSRLHRARQSLSRILTFGGAR